MKKVKFNDKFFEKWSPQMAYVLGYFLADGDLSTNPRGSHYLNFTSTDYELLKKTRRLLGVNHRIGKKKRYNLIWSQGYRLQIGSKKIFRDIHNLGFNKKKSSPSLGIVPMIYFRHFVRGFFDGDGNVGFTQYQYLKGVRYILLTRFASGSKKLLEELHGLLRKYVQLKGGAVYKNSRGYHLNFSIRDSIRLFRYMYEGVPKEEYLERKYNIFNKALDHFRGRSSVG